MMKRREKKIQEQSKTKPPPNYNKIKAYTHKKKPVESILCLPSIHEYEACSGMVEIASITQLEKTNFPSLSGYK